MQVSHALIIGGGSIGLRHAKNILALKNIEVAIVEPNATRVAKISNDLGVTVFASIPEAYAVKEWHMAFICSPTSYHLSNALEIARLGSHLFIEKPLAHTLDGLAELQEICATKNLISMVGSNWKFYPLFIAIKNALDSNKIGRVLYSRGEFGQYLPDWHPAEDYRQGYSANQKLGGGILFDSHEIDYLTWFNNSKVVDISCMSGKVSDLEIDVEDSADVSIRFANNSLGAVHMDYLQRFYRRTFEFVGTEGTIFWDNAKKCVEIEVVGKEKTVVPLEAGYDLNDMYVDEIKHFIACVESGTPTTTPIERGIEVLTYILAAKESAAKNTTIHL